ncbi:TetR/AcrR family transcriptional regulator [Pelosinus propionicus]|uniref:DNA-binding transcriptional regulator, AcrR family n=1 Tax=Pelosinus propionicus DSM 13327 TaxID=1123291 RepID=A0A1I4M9P8_9FIRM|nr:TetR/AcrR family transcriptional regulator [Pelosinus propionicus]SFL99783.1 DNA-binding transcriptional regulator, AcrR family [Pelosinus propionicus DSM 13327]
MSQHTDNRQQVFNVSLILFNTIGNALTMDQLAIRLSVPLSNLYASFKSKPELIKQLVSFILSKVRQAPLQLSHFSLADELCTLFSTYQVSCTIFSHTALSDLKLYYPEQWVRIMELRESQWQRISAAIEANIDTGRLRPIDINLLHAMIDGMLLEPFSQESPIPLPELVEILLYGIVRQAP